MSDEQQVQPVVLFPEVAALVHPIDSTVHPKSHGYRWAVMVGGRPPQDMDFCVGANQEPDEMTASVVAEMVGAAVVKGLRLSGVSAHYSFMRMGYDPIPAEADDRPMAYWPEESQEV
jgi:hypothetical protein